ncbi:hypothetical protein KFK09_005781 [Dendrobium nobile]|uniref:Uncharacterized protein n=1 Tax=Dendrobium nobile TaxID=94219 RepID=A0A8T3C2A7_DENNO|nr:hypothetical protein KFK09_005781 [Dendrobium nobile]
MWSVSNHILHISTHAVSPAPSPVLRSSQAHALHGLVQPAPCVSFTSALRSYATSSCTAQPRTFKRPALPALHLKNRPTPPQRSPGLHQKYKTPPKKIKKIKKKRSGLSSTEILISRSFICSSLPFNLTGSCRTPSSRVGKLALTPSGSRIPQLARRLLMSS